MLVLKNRNATSSKIIKFFDFFDVTGSENAAKILKLFC